MDKLVSYEYQDTDPENGVFRREWSEPSSSFVGYAEPYGSRPYWTERSFHHKNDWFGTQSFDLRIRLAHFLVKNKLEPKTGRARKYNALHYSGSFVLDTDMKVPVKIVQ